MDVSLYQAAAAMNATERWQDMIAGNLSTASTAGARKHDMSFSSVQAGLNSRSVGAGRSNYSIPSANATVNFQQGELRSTGSTMDFALEGSGFFTIQMPDGKNVYTRDGEFRLNAQSQLVTKQGYPVMSNGGPLQMDPNNPAPITVAATGEVSQGVDVKGTLSIVEFAKPQDLTMVSNGYFRNDNPASIALPSSSTSVRQGFIEAANTSPTMEMAGLITAMRMFETNQKVLQMQNDRMGRIITDLGGTS
jgi:flagellar basal-body rod protein FlgF